MRLLNKDWSSSPGHDLIINLHFEDDESYKGPDQKAQSQNQSARGKFFGPVTQDIDRIIQEYNPCVFLARSSGSQVGSGDPGPVNDRWAF